MNAQTQTEPDIIPGEQGALARMNRALNRAWAPPSAKTMSRRREIATGGGAVKRVRLEIGGDLIYRRGEGVNENRSSGEKT